ncbi:tRNA (cytidine(34)-2'-O)-methyltransferase [Devosia sp. XJ19-1]|uniref:tRNA (cytidine(34)-2'-O)-methyltransferase n=1 Tax=Devosia ureilytica TaxID=2952754 RepID=A0A9Q4APP0_9HYPH|nr:tRNA (cytidine(34)-2'-O)-methyltransferase [Devosia ureilytica]MCP8883927.1 tRNA (cytidine(34)-2'-O)-methyltransferase [Devosia ureilytica]MCP8887535.1 tRNA (cytidine(34)-2'-O)-methyltransferase [Devosia ureilytica]
MSIALALYQPDIAANTGTLLRLGACLGVTVHVIHPAGFALTDRNLARAGMDYLDKAALAEHASFAAFEAWRQHQARRLVLLTTKSSESAYAATFAPGDILLLGRESAGVPDSVAQVCDLRLRIPMQPGLRSINMALAGGMILGEALRQTGAFPVLSDAAPL